MLRIESAVLAAASADVTAAVAPIGGNLLDSVSVRDPLDRHRAPAPTLRGVGHPVEDFSRLAERSPPVERPLDYRDDLRIELGLFAFQVRFVLRSRHGETKL